MDIQIGDLINKHIYISIVVGCLVSSLITYVFISRVKKPDSGIPAVQISDIGTADLNGARDVVADLGGAVKAPGVYKLPAESRVVDLIKIGGGVVGQASNEWVSKNLNLSTKLQDSQKVYIPFDWDLSGECKSMSYDDAIDFIYNQDESSASSFVISDSGGGLVDVNAATLAQLDALPGVGSAYAKKIADLRPYNDFVQLGEKTKIPQTTLDKIKDLIKF